MRRLSAIELLTEGTFPSQSGEEVTITPRDILELAETYRIDLHEGFIVPGHSSDPMFGVPDTDTAVSLGWIKQVYTRVGEDGKLRLLGELDIHPVLWDWMAQQLYKYKSIAFYPREDSRNPTPGKLYIRHLAVLGSQPPAIKGLGALLTFAEGEEKMTVALKTSIQDTEKEKMAKRLSEETRNITADKDAPVLEDEDLQEGDDIEGLSEGKPGKKEEFSKAPNTGESTDDPEDEDPEGVKEKKGLHTGESISGNASVAKKPEGLSEVVGFAEEDEDEIDVADPSGVADEDRDAFARENIPIMLEQVLSSGPRGYKGEITRFDPEPAADNNYLFSVADEKFMGKFIDESEDLEEVYTFEMKRDGDGWSFEYALDSSGLEEFSEEENEPTGEELAAQLDPDDQEEEDSIEGLSEGRAYGEDLTVASPETTFREARVHNHDQGVGRMSKMDYMAQEMAAMKAQLMEMKEMMIDALMTQTFGEDRLLPSNMAENDFRAFAESLYDLSKASNPVMCAFSEGTEEKASVYDVFKSLVTSLPKQVEVGVALSEGGEPVEETRILTPIPASGFSQDPDGLKLFSEIVQFCEANSLNKDRARDFAKAHREVLKQREDK